ncbi:MAG TPA: hypothetical protein VNF99_02370 [Stellaceae bacterium]|nr:hypothetical protein [Stellaceae bacterium]
MAIATLAYAKHLEGAGIDRHAAEAHAEAMAHYVFPQLASKADIEKLGTELKLWLVLTSIAVAGLAIGIAKAL